MNDNRRTDLPVCPDQSGRVPSAPSTCPRIHIVYSLALCAGVCVSVYLGEEEGALPLPVLCIDEAGDNAGYELGGTAV